jgi:hypothetical protein
VGYYKEGGVLFSQIYFHEPSFKILQYKEDEVASVQNIGADT